MDALAERAMALSRVLRHDEAHALLDRAARRRGAGGAAGQDARLLLARGYDQYFRHAIGSAADTALAARNEARVAGQGALAARCLAFHATCLLRGEGERQWRRAMEAMAQARAEVLAVEGEGGAHDRAETIYLADLMTGTLEHYAGRLDRALAAYQSALDHCIGTGDIVGIGALRHRVAFVETTGLRERWFERTLRAQSADAPVERDACQQARARVEASLAHAMAHGISTTVPADTVSLAFICYLDGRPQETLSHLARVKESLPAVGQWYGEAIYAVSDGALALLALGRRDEAREQLTRLLDDLQAGADPEAIAMAWRAGQMVYAAHDETDRAAQAEARALLAWDDSLALRARIAAALDVGR